MQCTIISNKQTNNGEKSVYNFFYVQSAVVVQVKWPKNWLCARVLNNERVAFWRVETMHIFSFAYALSQPYGTHGQTHAACMAYLPSGFKEGRLINGSF